MLAAGSHQLARVSLVLACTCLFAVSPAKAQIGAGALTGTITDQTGSGCPGRHRSP